MEIQEDIMKKKRTKRPRPASPLSLTMATSSCTTADGSNDYVVGSPSSSGGLMPQTVVQDHQAEQDMAKCLILLAHGSNKRKPSQENSSLATATHKTAPSASNEVYQCKTCNRCFHSFQALGGHRASHKKPKATQEDHHHREPVETTKLSLQISSVNRYNPSDNINKVMRIHECSICGAEFSSGQALGGHMRRHRPIPMVNQEISQDQDQVKKSSRPLFSFDLNLPAPEDDNDHHIMESKFPFAAKEQVIVFSTSSPLVNCTY